MNGTSANRLNGVVIQFINMEALLPQYKGCIGLDIRIARGELHIGQRIEISGPDVSTESKIIGVEARHDPGNPKVIRIHCNSPLGISIPNGFVEGWTISAT